jgi:hypothetical protein
MSDAVFSFIKSPHPFFSGTASLSGTVKNTGNPNTPVQRVVVLFAEIPSAKNNSLKRTNLHYIAEKVSESNGTWQFDNLSPDFLYTVQSWDDTGLYAPVIGAGLVAT